MADIGTEFELGEIVLVLGGIIVIGYFVYKGAQQAGSILDDAVQSVLAVPGKMVEAASNLTGIGSWGMGGGKDTYTEPLEDSAPEVPGG